MIRENRTNKDLFDNVEHPPNHPESKNQLVENTLEAEISNCSCPECDSLRCFTIQRDLAKSACACNDCKPSNMCMVYSKDKPESKPILKTQKSYESYKTYSSLPRNVDFCEKTSYHKTVKTKDGQFDKIIESKYNYKAILADKNYTVDSVDECRETSITRLENTFLRYPCKDISKTTAQLSAQIMNVPIKDFKQSFSIDKKRDDIVSRIGNVKQDIFSRLKEIYKACSCKVCECIPVTSFFPGTETCSCKPCECNECKDLYRYICEIKETPHDGCPCIRCDRKDCRGITKGASKIMNCNCKPCQCIKCSESFSKPCTCEPCRCLECRSMPLRSAKAVFVAPVQEYVRRDLCDCSPCECSNCTHNYNTTSNMRARSTGTVTQSFCPCDTCTNDSCQSDGASCRCETHKGIMKKPIQRDGYDYDIRRLFITNVWPKFDPSKKINKTDIIAMYAKTQQDCSRDKKVKECECDECKCISCIKSNRNSSVPNTNFGKRETCEYNKCNKYLGKNKSIIIKESECKCNNCECFNCGNFDDSRSKTTINNACIRPDFLANYAPNHCNCDSCECINCMQNNLGQCLQDQPTRQYVIKKDTKQTPSLCKIVINGSQLPSKPFLKAMTKDMNLEPTRSSKRIKSKHNVSIYHVLSQHKNYESEKSFTIFDRVEDPSIYFSTRNSNELLTPSFSRYERMDYVAHRKSYDILSFRGKSSSIPVDNKDINNSQLPHLQLLLEDRQTTGPFLDFSEQLDTRHYSNKNNYDHSKNIKYSNSLYGEKNKRMCPMYMKTLYSKDIATFDYNKVKNTLQDAQDFSVKLNEILETYEMANNNFVSISQKLKQLHETIFNSTDMGSIQPNQHFTQNHDDNIVGDNKIYPMLVESPANSKESSITSNSTTSGNETKLKPIFGSHNLLENVDCVQFQNSVHNCEDDFGDRSKSGKCTPSRLLNYSNSRIKKRHKLNQGFYKHSKIILKRLSSNPKIITRKRIVNKFTETTSDVMIKKLPLLNTSTCTDKCETQQDISLNTTVTCIFKDADFYKDACTSSADNYFLNADDNTSNRGDLALELILQPKKTNKNPKTLDSVQPINVLRKNLFINTEKTTPNKYICKIPLLEEDIKQVLGIISREIRRDTQENVATPKRKQSNTMKEKTFRRYLDGLVSRAMLESELKATKATSLIDRPSKTSVKISRPYDNQETLKANFYNLRRISDHTVLIKWNIPHDISEVQGYELQVDGRAVQKIFNPTRSIAVITCLPHCDKVLISIRTLTRNETCNPISTTVYHPRIK
ncbi:unnamed protein product [Colias eurytheme]|nr:unnamed protein product [Colias eurytheme]